MDLPWTAAVLNDFDYLARTSDHDLFPGPLLASTPLPLRATPSTNRGSAPASVGGVHLPPSPILRWGPPPQCPC
eukprot:7064273-Prorocentrum_lima.AAC.1